MIRYAKPSIAAVLVAVSAACTGFQYGRVSPEQIPELENRATSEPNDPAVQLSLGEAYYAAERYTDARTALNRALALEPDNDETRLFLGFTLDELGDLDGAREQFDSVLVVQSDPAVRRVVEERLMLLDRKAAAAAARAAIGREQQLAGQSPDPNTVAVLPLLYTGSNPDLKPLERGLAEIMVSDLGIVSRLTVVERLQMQALLDELNLAESGRTQAGTAARTGRLVQAANVIQGTIADAPNGQLRVDASVVASTNSQVAGRPSQTDDLQQLLQMEKQIVLSVLDVLNVQLTPAERERLLEVPTQNVLAFLQFSNGLVALDNGDYSGAESAFRQAASIDPSFSQAQQAARQSSQLSAAQQANPQNVAARTQGSARRAQARARLRVALAGIAPTVADALNSTDGTDTNRATQRKEVQEGTDRQGVTEVTRTTTIIITVRRP